MRLVFDTQELRAWTPQCSSDSLLTQSLALFVQSSVSILSLVPKEHYSALILILLFSNMYGGGLSWVKIINVAMPSMKLTV